MNQAIIGWRVWDLKDNELLPLYVSGDPWEKDNIAVCNSYVSNHSSPGIPDPGCSCGLHAYYDLASALKEYHRMGYKKHRTVFGLVAGRGQTEMHATGFRSHKMSIIAIASFDSNREPVERVAESLGVPYYASLEEIMLVHKELESKTYTPGTDEKPKNRLRYYIRSALGLELIVATILFLLSFVLLTPIAMLVSHIFEINNVMLYVLGLTAFLPFCIIFISSCLEIGSYALARKDIHLAKKNI